jgi:hypothetical protein
VNHLHLWGHPQLLRALDADMRVAVEGALAMQSEVQKMYASAPGMAAVAEDVRFSESAATSSRTTYLLWLLKVGRLVAPSFEREMVALLPEGCFHRAPLKGLLRCMEKLREDYSHLDTRGCRRARACWTLCGPGREPEREA